MKYRNRVCPEDNQNTFNFWYIVDQRCGKVTIAVIDFWLSAIQLFLGVIYSRATLGYAK